MKEQINHHATTDYIRQDDKLYIHTKFNDDHALHQNQRIRNSGMLDKGKLGIHQGEDIRMAISCPDTVQWGLFKKKHKETHDLLFSKNEAERMKGARQLQILKPSWVVYSRL